MNTITNLFKRFMVSLENIQPRPAAVVVEPVEGRVLMSASLIPTAAFGDGSVRPMESLSLNFTKIT